MPDWIEHTIWWQVFPLGFVGAEPETAAGAPVVHRLGHLQAWLDYAVELGATGLALGPVFAASTHGYDTVDPFRVDPRLGDEADLVALIEAAHARGLRVLLDGVFNHVGRAHPAFQEVLQQGERAPRAGWFKLSWPHGGHPGAEPDYACFEGHRQLVTLNHDAPPVADYVVSIMTHWLARGVDGWRLDAAYAVPRRFWADVLGRVRSAHPDAYLLGEVIHGDYAALVRDTGLDAVTQYELWKAIWSALNDRNLFELAHALDRHIAFLDTFVPLTFVGNHDVTRIASRLVDERHLPHALAILLVCGGTPSIYAGDEQAFRGLKEDRIGGDDAIRPVFPDTPADLAPFGWPIYRLHQTLIGLRRRHAWLHRARTRTLHLTNTQLVLSVGDGTRRLLLALNLAEDAAVVPAPDARSVEAGEAVVTDAGTRDARASLGPHRWAVLAV
ncbi:alpha-amylase family protein [Methylobacterium sp. Leaf117]|uniref:alpha-amylase family protein n=1 Tax=Methylobacterium sp. Leaf117 TaxID=1736260 RepID=UPI0006F44734|nr:alpha-amylase family protein [Methylobacterium sp. Leaf117]KQP83337.1 alpha-amylase [Methylobacterium sp. Leaf117]